jgi:DNA-binding response OmpR family regulator
MDSSAHTILLVEGPREDEDSLSAPLERAGFAVVCFQTGREALAWAHEQTPDLVVFDASTMRSSGLRTCRRLRGLLEQTPLIHCRPDGTPVEEQLAADVYLQQPFTGRKLLNRVYDLLPADPETEEIVRYGRITLFLEKKSVHVDGRGEQRLTPKLAGLLEELLRHAGELVTRKQLMKNVWLTDYMGDTRTLDVHIRWARELIEDDPSDPRILTTVRGHGFILK